MEILQFELEPMAILIELVAAGAADVVVEDISILKLRNEKTCHTPRSPGRHAFLGYICCIPRPPFPIRGIFRTQNSTQHARLVDKLLISVVLGPLAWFR